MLISCSPQGPQNLSTFFAQASCSFLCLIQFLDMLLKLMLLLSFPDGKGKKKRVIKSGHRLILSQALCSHLPIRKILPKLPALFQLTHSIRPPSKPLLLFTSLGVCQEFCNLTRGFFRANYLSSSEPKKVSLLNDRKRKKTLLVHVSMCCPIVWVYSFTQYNEKSGEGNVKCEIMHILFVYFRRWVFEFLVIQL